MKLIKAMIAEAKLEAVKNALLAEGVQGMTFYPVQGFGIHRAQLAKKINRNYQVDLQTRIMLEIVLADDEAEKAAKVVAMAARTGRLGDGKIFILQVEDAIRIRTGEHGAAGF